MKNVWVLGCLGMLGTEVMARLEKMKINAIGTDKKEANIASLEDLEEFCKGKEISHIINCAAYTKVDLAEKETYLAHLINAQGPKNVGILSKKIGAKVLHFSTDYIFSGESSNPYSENDPANPLNAYGKTKYEGEIQLLEANSSACVIRSSWLFGLHGNNFISKMLSIMQQKQEVRVVADQIGRPTFCEDLAEAACHLLPYSGIFHFANDEETSWYELTRCIHEEAEQAGFKLTCKEIIPITSAEYPASAKRPLYSVLDTKKIEQVLGIRPRPWKEALRIYIRKYFQSLCQ